MTIERKLLGTNPSSTGTAATANVADVFSTHVYTGNATNRTITNGIDLDGEGGLIWTKSRSQGLKHILTDTTRSLGSTLYTNTATPASNDGGIVSLNSDGYNINTGGYINTVDADLVSWTFRKAPKFFDMVTWTGNSVIGHQISHNLGCEVGMLVVKSISRNGSNWVVYHRSLGTSVFLGLNSTTAASTGTVFPSVTSTSFTLNGSGDTNLLNETYIAYLFADNSAEAAGNQMIKCGSYTGNGSPTGVEVDLGWEPQYLLIKNSSQIESWVCVDSMRGLITGDSSTFSPHLSPNSFSAEVTTVPVHATSTGFAVLDSDDKINASGETYIYMAIRGPMMKEPESGTEVYAANTYAGDNANGRSFTGLGLTPDVNIITGRGGMPNCIGARLLGQGMFETDSTSVSYATLAGWMQYDMDGFTFPTKYNYSNSTGNNYVAHNFKRAKGFFDVVAYSGNSVSGRAISHSLGSEPDFVIIKSYDSADSWSTTHRSLGGGWGGQITLNTASKYSTTQNFTADPDSSSLYLTGSNPVNVTGKKYMAYLFASLNGISSVSGYIGNGSGGYSVTVANSGGGNKYVINGTPATTLELVEGNTYTFNVSDPSNSGHPLRFSTTSNGSHSGGSTYTNGVMFSGTPGTSGSFIRITVPVGAPTLYYYCTNHSNMGGTANTNVSRIINCGFSAGARFVLIKRTDVGGDWYIWDTTRGIVAGNDPHLSLNSVAAELTSDDSIDPTNSGFIVNQLSATNINVANGTYIYLAIA